MFKVSSFPCPNCHEFINSSMETCKYCYAPIDPQAAAMAGELQDKVNAACSDASLIRNMAGVMWLSFFVRIIPLIGLAAIVAMVILFFVIPIKLLLWQMKYGSLQTKDADYKRAKTTLLISLGLWVLIIVVLVALALISNI